MSCSDWIAPTKDAIVAIAAMVTAGAAVSGLRTWKRELTGRAEYETARSLMRATYRLRDEINAARGPTIREYEYPETYNPLESTSPQNVLDTYTHIYEGRLRPVRRAIREFETWAVEAEALWGSDIRAKTREFTEIVDELRRGAGGMIDVEVIKSSGAEVDQDHEQRMRAIIHASRYDAQNPLSQKLDRAVESIEAAVRPHLARPK